MKMTGRIISFQVMLAIVISTATECPDLFPIYIPGTDSIGAQCHQDCQPNISPDDCNGMYFQGLSYYRPDLVAYMVMCGRCLTYDDLRSTSRTRGALFKESMNEPICPPSFPNFLETNTNGIMICAEASCDKATPQTFRIKIPGQNLALSSCNPDAFIKQ